MTPINQVVLPLNLGYKIPEDDPVILLSEICDKLDYTRICNKYLKTWRIHSPKVIFKILAYAYMRKIFSLREIEAACRRDICFMWLLNYEPVPDHTTIDRFIDEKLADEMEDLFYQLIEELHKLGELKFEHLFIDGTKIEAYANRYTFVWAKSVKKNAEKLYRKINMFMDMLADRYCVQYDTAEEYFDFLAERIKDIVCVFGKGKRKTQLQRDYEQMQEYMQRKDKYAEYFKILGTRKSFSKTDTDATFMRMKDDHMRNGQLKPGYNVQIGVEGEYIVGAGLFPNPTDVGTFIPFLERVKSGIGKIIRKVIADAGYESEENYTYLEENGQTTYIKPQNYEISKTRKYQKDGFRVENMEYDELSDSYICKDGRRLEFKYTQKTTSSNGYVLEKSVYQNESCGGCPYRDRCHKSKNDHRTIRVSKRFSKQREISRENILTDEGIMLRMNRSIQVEGAFGVIKEDYSFRRFLMRGKRKAETQFFLLSFAYDVQKYFNKLSSGRTGTDLFKMNME